MKTAILTIALALASSLSALAQTVMRENSTVYFKTNVYLHDDPTNALHTRISAEGMEPLWVAASNQVAYYQSGEMTNASIHARYLFSTNAYLGALKFEYLYPYSTEYGIRWEGEAGIHNKFGNDGKIFFASPYNSGTWWIMNTRTQHWWGVGESGISNALWFTKNGLHMTNPYRINSTNVDIGISGSVASMRLTAGMNINASVEAGWTNTISSMSDGQSVSIVAADSIGTSPHAGSILLTPGIRFGTVAKVKITRGRLEADEIKADKIGLAYVVTPGGELLSAWLQSDGTNLFFVSTVGTGFTNALTTNTP